VPGPGSNPPRWNGGLPRVFRPHSAPYLVYISLRGRKPVTGIFFSNSHEHNNLVDSTLTPLLHRLCESRLGWILVRSARRPRNLPVQLDGPWTQSRKESVPMTEMSSILFLPVQNFRGLNPAVQPEHGLGSAVPRCSALTLAFRPARPRR